MSKYLCADCVLKEQCDGEWTMRCSRYVSVEHKQTNEEWFCSLSTEEKAKFLRKIYRDGRDDYVGEWYEQTEADFVEWLREIYKE